MRNEYAQKMNDFITQNKALQDQVQTLNARVSTLESELTQMVHVMTRQYQNQSQNQNQNQYQNNGYQNGSSYAVPTGQLAQYLNPSLSLLLNNQDPQHITFRRLFLAEPG